jgi:diguanylate cyclase (GGDEF)-like protein
MTPTRPGAGLRRVPPAFVALIVAVIGIGIGGVAAIGALPATAPGQVRLPWWVMTIPFAAFDLIVLNVQIRREARSVSLSEIPMAIALAFCVPVDLIAARVLGAALIYVLLRRQYRQPVKLLFNVAVAFTEAVLALAAFRLVTMGRGPITPLAWLGTDIGNVVASCFAAFAVGVVIGVFEGSLSGRELVAILPVSSIQAAMVSTIGLICVVTLDASRMATILLVLAGAAFVLAYRAYATLNERHLSLERVYRFTQAMSSSREMSDVMLGVLTQAREMLHAEQALLTFLSPTDQGLEISLGRSGTLQRSQATILTGEDGSPLAAALSGSGAVLVGRGDHDSGRREWLHSRGVREIVAVPLRGDSGAIATLAVVDRLGEARGFDREDVRLLETVANHASIALQNGRLVDQLRHESQHDALTGLPNRLFFQRSLTDHLSSIPPAKVLVVGVLDLDNFKDVNDTLGHEAGDELLREVATRLSTAGGSQTVVARLGGDEFAVTYFASPDRPLDTARALAASLHHPVLLNGVEVEVGGSVGVATTADARTSRETLLKHADAAMYRAKTNVDDVCLWEPNPADASTDRLTLVTKLRGALQSDAVEVYVQPKVSLMTGELSSVEALVRWNDPERGFVAPDEFVPLAERSGLIRPLTEFVLQTSIAACAQWQLQLPGVGVAVNVSVKNLTDEALLERVRFLLRRYNLAPSLLTLEITESTVMSDPARMLAVLNDLHNHGVRLSIDDFGTGYSSLSYLQRLPVQEVKIDRTFVADLSADRDNTAISRSIIELATALQLSVVAEGVESEADWELLRELDCTTGQGFLIAEAMPIADLVAWHATWGGPVLGASAG